MRWDIVLVFAVCALSAFGDAYPHAVLSNGRSSVIVYHPDATNGYYRSSRFVSASMMRASYGGVNCFSDYRVPHDPLRQDAASGCAEEFSMPIGFENAAAGGPFLKVGVGVLTRPDGKPYDFSREYAVRDAGRWTVQSGPMWSESVHEAAFDGYAYRYRRRITLSNYGFIVEHALSNAGKKTIVSSHYAHNFFSINGKPIGPGYAVNCNFYLMTGNKQPLLTAFGASDIRFLRAFGSNESFGAYPAGLVSNCIDAAVCVSLQDAGGIIIRPRYPVQKTFFFAVSNAFCPEFFYSLNCAPGSNASWSTRYEFTKGRTPFRNDVIERNSKRGIRSISIDGKEFGEYTPDKRMYRIVKFSGDNARPRVSAAATRTLDAVRITQAAVPGTALIVFRSGTVSAEYAIAFKRSSLAAVNASTAGANPPVNTLDGDLETSWSGEGEQWISFDLGAARKLTGIGIAWRAGDKRRYRYSVAVSPDNSAWKSVYSGESTGRTNDIETALFPASVGRYVRIDGQGNNLNRWNNITETIFITDEGVVQ